MKVLVTGGRTHRSQWLVWQRLEEFHELNPITELINGDAQGVDTYAKRWAIARGVKVTSMPVTQLDWDRYGKRAGNVRNYQMLMRKPDVLIVFQGHTGTTDMISKAKDMRDVVILYSWSHDWYEVIKHPFRAYLVNPDMVMTIRR